MNTFKNWEDFWKEWHKTEITDEADLYYQVAKTINKKPIAKEIFDLINKSIAEILSLTKNDTLIELCCGNGLCTYEFRDVVKQVIAVDFSPHLLQTAVQYKSAPNITYCEESIFDFLDSFGDRWDFLPHKFLMNDSLAYFDPDGLQRIVQSMVRISGGDFTFLIRGVPNDELKWNYYNTDERKQRYLDNAAKGDFTNDGMGRWWKPAEIENVCKIAGVSCSIRNQQPPISNYRMDVLISKS